MTRFATQGLEPDLTVLLDVDVATTVERLGDRRDRIEQAGTTFFGRVRAGYLDLAAQHADCWVVVDGEGTVDEVADRVASQVNSWLSRR